MALPIHPFVTTRMPQKIIDNRQLVAALDKAKTQCQDEFVSVLNRGDDDMAGTLSHRTSLINYCKGWLEENKGISPTSIEVQEFKYKLLNAGIKGDIVSGWLSGLGKQ